MVFLLEDWPSWAPVKAGNAVKGINGEERVELRLRMDETISWAHGDIQGPLIKLCNLKAFLQHPLIEVGYRCYLGAEL